MSKARVGCAVAITALLMSAGAWGAAVQTTQISAGNDHTCARMSDGTLRCWGGNSAGQLGDGSTTNAPRNLPFQIAGLTNVVAVAGGSLHTCTALADGTARCWGNNQEGELGDSTTTDRGLPVAVSGLTNAVAIAAGSFHTCARLSDNTVRCWGSNSSGQLASDPVNLDHSSLPVQISGISNAVAIACGDSHTCALLSNGTVSCWGMNVDGELGDGSTDDHRATPGPVSGLTGVTAISSGFFHTCALLADGGVRCWGANDNGAVGNNGMNPERSPVAVSGLTNVAALGAGNDHSCAVSVDGTVSCWGSNHFGELGRDPNGITLSRVPVTVAGIHGAIGFALGDVHTCALQATGAVLCWGYNVNGELGNGQFGTGNNTSSFAPVLVQGLPSAAATVPASNPLTFAGLAVLLLSAGATIARRPSRALRDRVGG